MDVSVPKVMGIVNITPDSFYSQSRVSLKPDILKLAEKMLSEGADILDVGGYSTRPGAVNISVDDELKRTVGALEAILSRFPEAILSVDTFRSQVATEAVNTGAAIINDISGGTLDEQMFATVAKLGCPYILMHIRGNPQTMAKHTSYEDVALEVLGDLEKKVHNLQSRGVKDIIVDPGFGFAKTVEQNFELLKNLGHFKTLQVPVLVGVSRKSFIYKTLRSTPESALNGSSVLHTVALVNGAQILRVHDVKEAVEVVNLVTKYDSV